MLSVSSRAMKTLGCPRLSPAANNARLIRSDSNGTSRPSRLCTQANGVGEGGIGSIYSHPVLGPMVPMATLLFSQHGLDLFDKVTHILEFAINRGEAHVRHLVELLEIVHHQFADDGYGDLTEILGIDVVLDLTDDGFDLFGADGPLVASPF